MLPPSSRISLIVRHKESNSVQLTGKTRMVRCVVLLQILAYVRLGRYFFELVCGVVGEVTFMASERCMWESIKLAVPL